jgi:cysteine desulfurase
MGRIDLSFYRSLPALRDVHPRRPYNSSVERVYLDHNATTPLDPRVLDAMEEALGAAWGNPSSLHWFGQQARAAVENARADVAALVGAAPAEIVFTGSGTEADNMALRGLAAAAPRERRKVVVAAIEHHAVIRSSRALVEAGHGVELVRAREDGVVDLDELARRVDDRTGVVALMLANNETGVIQPVAEAASIARSRGAAVHCDAVQAAGKMAVDVVALGVDTLALSAHKLYGPQGVGALFVRRGARLAPLVLGGSQERNRRAGTENVAGVVGFGRAAQLARELLAREPAEISRMRDLLEERLLSLPGARRNGDGPRVANTTNVSFEGADAESLLMALDLAGVAVSTGAACAAGAVEPSHVLRGMGLPLARAQSSLRFSLGRSTTEAGVLRAAEAVEQVLERQRQLARSAARSS